MPYRNRIAPHDDVSYGNPMTRSDLLSAPGDPDLRAKVVRVVAGQCRDVAECRQVLDLLGLTVADIECARRLPPVSRTG